MRVQFLLLPLILPLSGCLVAAAAGAAYGYIKYDKNEAQQDFETSVGRLWRASIDGLEARSYPLPEGLASKLRDDQDTAEIDGDGYWLRVEEYPNGRSRLRVRVGMFESEENRRKAKLLIESIGKRL
jgi:Protein of unknown function (DUF3568)